MGADHAGRFVALVESRTPALLRSARILTGDPRRADQLVQAALARARRRRGEAGSRDTESDIEQAVLDGYLSWWRRPWRSREGATPAATSSGVGLEDVVAGVLDGLAPRQRAVLVLAEHRGLSPSEIADRVGLSQGAVNTQDVRARALVRSAAADWTSAQDGAEPSEVSDSDLSSLIAEGLRRHENDTVTPTDPVRWVEQGVRRRRRRVGGVVVAGLAAVVVVALTAAPQVTAPKAELSLDRPPEGHALLTWPAVGEHLTDTALLQGAVNAWSSGATRGQRPVGAVYPLVAAESASAPYVVLEGTDESGATRVALVAGRPGRLVASDSLPDAGSPVEALFLPGDVVGGGGGGLVLAPAWRADAVSPNVGLALSESAGWQQNRRSAHSYLNVFDSSDPYPDWDRLEYAQASPWLAWLSTMNDGTVVLSRTANSQLTAGISTLTLPPAGSSGLVPTSGDVTLVDVSGTGSFEVPTAYDQVVAAWKHIGRTGPVEARVLASDGSSVNQSSTFNVFLAELAGPGRESPVLVQVGTMGPQLTGARRRGSRTVCDDALDLRTGGIDSYPFVVAACTFAVPESGTGSTRSSLATVYHGWATPSVGGARVVIDVSPRAGERPTTLREPMSVINGSGLISVGDRGSATGDVSVTAFDPASGDRLGAWTWPRP